MIDIRTDIEKRFLQHFDKVELFEVKDSYNGFFYKVWKDGNVYQNLFAPFCVPNNYEYLDTDYIGNEIANIECALAVGKHNKKPSE